MKFLFFYSILFLSLNSCSKHEIQVNASNNLQEVVDSLLSLNNKTNNVYELFIDKGSEYQCFITLHIGPKSLYKENVLSLCYFVSHNNKVNIYSGIESYFNLPHKNIDYEVSNNIDMKDHSFWTIQMYKDDVVEVYSNEYVNPFLLIPSSPNRFIVPEISN